ncbi:hypothetical protein C9413_11340 [Rhizobium sp. SEMIA 4085]|uniref:Antifreeze protein n=1 Tax=Rhizobium gallicum bv. gallicum R602sp TaxID=1041138 RepID=A0A0B4X1T5_9HYPH|nr:MULTISPECIES: hypothetical protein [Rhizobium]AJD41904.1 hypothetical protein RGR602_CH02582 [Rhizobium gallicum bv. gallicum R602sp]NNH30072.1 hypothetical protein [Rhizobium sp. SEMIA 4085]
MTNFIAKASFAALLAVTSIPATVSTAAAAGPERAVVIDVQYHRPPPVYRGCSPVAAVRKARWTGLRDVRVVNVTPRRVVVAGRDRRGWDRMAFANVRGCPLIRR